MTSLLQRSAGAIQLVFVVAVVGSAILLSASLKPDSSTVRPRATADRLPVTVVEPTPATYISRVQLNGVVESRTVTSIIPQVSGRIVDVAPTFRTGARVKAGDILFVIDPADYELAIGRTLAEIEVARSELASAIMAREVVVNSARRPSFSA